MCVCLASIKSISSWGETIFEQLGRDEIFSVGAISGSIVVLILCAIVRSIFKPTSVKSLEKVIKTLNRTIAQQKKDLDLKNLRIDKCHKELEDLKYENDKLKQQIKKQTERR